MAKINTKIILIIIFEIIGLVLGVKREEILSLDPYYSVRWEVNVASGSVTFDLVAHTTGFVGFGISNGGGMSGADIFIGGVHPNGTEYFGDYHTSSNTQPILDAQLNWNLTSASENGTHTRMTISRLLSTCDEQDTPITSDTTYFIWAFGATDEIKYHGTTHRGNRVINVLDPPSPDVDLSKFKVWRVNRTTTYTNLDTSYWSTIHKMPNLNGTHYVVAFRPNLISPEAKKHTHHLTLFHCQSPSGKNATEFFEPMVRKPGWESYGDPASPLKYCFRILYVWATGGNAFIFPENVGFPINEKGKNEYYMFEIHFDNPENLKNVKFEASVDIFYTSEKRKFDAGLAIVAHNMNTSQMIPPKSPSFTTVGHCSSKCTTRLVPEGGVNVFNAFLHSHKSGRKLKVRQFRNGKELPWIANDENYDFDYQQNRPFRKYVKVLPGDHLSYECQTNTEWTNGTVLAGFSSRDEMCQAFLWYYPKSNLGFCGSYYTNFEKLFGYFGIEHVNWTSWHDYDPIVTLPSKYANKTFTQVLNSFPPSFWTQDLRNEIQKELRYGEHEDFTCGPSFVKYPHFDTPYVRQSPCDSSHGNSILTTNVLSSFTMVLFGLIISF